MKINASSPENDQLEMVIKRMIRGVNTSIPGIIKSFNVETQTVQVTPAIKAIQTTEGERSFKPLPDLFEVPAIFPYSNTSGFSITFPVKPGDECLIIFSQRSIDNWHDKGDIQVPVETTVPRCHDLSDGIAIVGLSSLPNKISDFQEDGVEIRNSDRSTSIKVAEDEVEVKNKSGSSILMDSGGNIVIEPAGKTTHNGDMEVTGNVDVTGKITATAEIEAQGEISSAIDIKAGLTSLKTHLHTGNLGNPTSPPTI